MEPARRVSGSPIRTVIVEDEAPARTRLVRFLAALPDVEIVGEADSGYQAIALIERTSPDLVVLDIKLPDMTGFEILERLTDRPHVIFSTSFDNYAIKAFEVEAVDFMLKPYEAERVAKALERVRTRLQAAQPPPQVEGLLRLMRQSTDIALDRIALRDKEHILLARIDEVFYFVAEGETVYARLAERKLPVKRALRELEGTLEAKRFFRANRAVLINLNMVREIHPWFGGRYVVRFNRLDPHEQIEVSRRQARKLQELIY